MTPEQFAAFAQQGYLYLPRALGSKAVQPVKAHVLAELKRLNIWAGRMLSDRLKGVPLFQQVGKLGQLLKYPGLRERLMSPELVTAMRKLAGAELVPEPEGQLLVSLPKQGEWTLAGLNWHRDIAQTQLAQIPGVQAFVLLDELVPQGGATLALKGSHRCKGRVQGPVPDGGNRVVMGDAELPVLEMTGQAGDVYLMDMRLVHSPSINAAKRPRLMATIRYLRQYGPR